MTQRLRATKETKFSMYVPIFVVKRHVSILSNRRSNINYVLYENTILGVGVEWKYEFWGRLEISFLTEWHSICKSVAHTLSLGKY